MTNAVDGSEIPNNHLVCIRPYEYWDFNYQSQLVSLPDCFQPSTVALSHGNLMETSRPKLIGCASRFDSW